MARTYDVVDPVPRLTFQSKCGNDAKPWGVGCGLSRVVMVEGALALCIYPSEVDEPD